MTKASKVPTKGASFVAILSRDVKTGAQRPSISESHLLILEDDCQPHDMLAGPVVLFLQKQNAYQMAPCLLNRAKHNISAQ
jgi:hypothetical protein